jgi:hypothetical protein
MARESKVIALVIDKHLAKPITSSSDKKHSTKDMDAAVGDEYILNLLFSPRSVGEDSVSGGKFSVTVCDSIFTGEGSFFTTAGGLARDLFANKKVREVTSGSDKDYVAFLVLPENLQMGQLPIAQYKNKKYWHDQVVLTYLFVPKELI